MTRRGQQTDLKLALRSLVGHLDRSGAYASLRAAAAWERAARGLIANHTTGAHLRSGVLVIHVDGNSWATHFTAEAEQCRCAVNKELGEELVREVRFVVSRKAAKEQTQVDVERIGEELCQAGNMTPIPLTEIELEQVRASVGVIPNEGLRDAVLRATVKDLERKKGWHRSSDTRHHERSP